MKANTRYTAKEILEAAGYENTDEIIGKMRVRIGGIRGIVTPDHLITVQRGAENLQLVVGNEEHYIEIEGEEENRTTTENANEALSNRTGTTVDGAVEQE